MNYLAVFGKPRFLGILTMPENINVKKLTPIIVESQRGTEVALLIAPLTAQQEEAYRKIRTASEHTEGALRGGELAVTDLAFVRLGEDNIEEMQNELRAEEDGILRKSKELLIPHNLDMKLIDVELFWDRKKLFFYFTSEQRVDFRAFVRDLAREFKTRIELRQIGVRDEAKLVSGLASCGRECCCSYWLNQFSPICIKMVKEQNLALNPTKISGICGRLMCCMCFEHNAYKELWEHLPNPGSKFATPSGNVILLGVNLRKRSARCFVPGKGEVLVPIERFPEFKKTLTSGGLWQEFDPEVGCDACSNKEISCCHSSGRESHKKESSAVIHASRKKQEPDLTSSVSELSGISNADAQKNTKKSKSKRRRPESRGNELQKKVIKTSSIEDHSEEKKKLNKKRRRSKRKIDVNSNPNTKITDGD